MSMFAIGASNLSKRRADPPVHILKRGDGDTWVTWCRGGRAVPEDITGRQWRRCKQCLALARQDAIDKLAPGESSELDWFLNRTPKDKTPKECAAPVEGGRW